MTETTRIPDPNQVDLEDPDQLGKNPDNEAKRKEQRAAEGAGGSSAARERDKRAAELLETMKSEVGGIAADRLRSIVERIERLEEERKALGNDIKDIYAEAKSAGFEVRVVRTIIRLRKQEPAEVEEQETLLDLYKRALGM